MCGKKKETSGVPPEHPTGIDDQIFHNLRDLNHTMRMLRESKGSQKRILSKLGRNGMTTQKTLRENLGIQAGSLSEVLFKLEDAGLIVRSKNEKDHRLTDISLTESGWKAAQEAETERKKRHAEMFVCLNKDEKQELLNLLKKINADWQQRYQLAKTCDKPCRTFKNHRSSSPEME